MEGNFFDRTNTEIGLDFEKAFSLLSFPRKRESRQKSYSYPQMTITWQTSNELVSYTKAMNEMQKLVEGVKANVIPNTVWFLEHPHVYTKGALAKKNEAPFDSNIPVLETNRGGKFTYHGPGQRIVYLIIDLKEIFYPQQPDIKKYVWLLEETVIDILRHLKVPAERSQGQPGVWIANKKIAFLGVKIHKWIASHGLSFNIDPDLNHFKKIIPCGIQNCAITSLKELGIDITAQIFDQLFKEKFASCLKSHLFY